MIDSVVCLVVVCFPHRYSAGSTSLPLSTLASGPAADLRRHHLNTDGSLLLLRVWPVLRRVLGRRATQADDVTTTGNSPVHELVASGQLRGGGERL